MVSAASREPRAGTSREAPDPRAVLAALGQPGASAVVPVAGGADAAIWRVTLRGDDFALRLLGANQHGQAARERAAMEAAAAGGLPVPAVAAAGEWAGQPALLLAWAAGEPIGRAVLAHPARARHFGERLGEAQAHLHRTAAPAALMTRDWRAWRPPDAALAGALTALPATVPALLHLDFHPLNVLTDGDQVTAILDWANAHAGDPRADLARTAAILTHAPLPLTIDTAEQLRQELIAGWRAGYGSAAIHAPTMSPFLAWAGASMLREMAPRLGQAGLPWLTGAWLATVREWTNGQRAAAGLPPVSLREILAS